MLRAYKKDPYFLLRYYGICTLAYSSAIAALLWVSPWNFTPSIWIWLALLLPVFANSFIGLLLMATASVFFFFQHYWQERSFLWILLAVGGVYFGMVAVQLIHNCAHKSFRPLWLNRVWGELLSIHLLSGFPGFVILHLQHHMHPDDPNLDPHPNEDLGFFPYLFSIKKKLKSFFERSYSENWKHHDDAQKIWRLGQALLPLNRVLRLALLLLVAGPVGFTLFFIPSFIANHLTFAHINYYTHSRQPDGSFEIVNLHEGFVYRLLNLIMIGGYYHKNHHQSPSLFNPAHYKEGEL